MPVSFDVFSASLDYVEGMFIYIFNGTAAFRRNSESVSNIHILYLDLTGLDFDSSGVH